MELKLYQQLNKALLGDLAQAAARFDPAYQQAVERYAPQAESGIKGWGKDAIELWLKEYAKLMPKPVRLRYYQIFALYFTEGVLREKRAGTADFAGRKVRMIPYRIGSQMIRGISTTRGSPRNSRR